MQKNTCENRPTYYFIEMFMYLMSYYPLFLHSVEAGKPHAVSVRTLGHTVEMATAGGPRGGRVSDWGGG